MTGGQAVSPFGARLRQWRTHRGVSQLALAAKVGSTPRHLSFLEIGRSRPSRQMVSPRPHDHHDQLVRRT